MIKKLFYLPIFTLVLISNTFSDNTVNKNPQVIDNNVSNQIKMLEQKSSKQVQSNKVIPIANAKLNNNIANRLKMFENSSTVKQQVHMPNNTKQIAKNRINIFERNNNNLYNRNIPKTSVYKSNRLYNTAQIFNNTKQIDKNKIKIFEQNNKSLYNRNVPRTPVYKSNRIQNTAQIFNKNPSNNNQQQKSQVNRSNKIINKAQNFNKPIIQQNNVNNKVPGKLNISDAQRNQMNRIVGKHNYMLVQYNINNPSSYTIPNKKPIPNNNLKQNTNQIRIQQRLMKGKKQAINNKQPVKIINRQVLQQQQTNTDSPIHRELTQHYNNRNNNSITSQLQNIINAIKNNKNISNDEIISQSNQWNTIINNAVDSKLSKEYINNVIQTVINSSNIKSSNFYNNIIKSV